MNLIRVIKKVLKRLFKIVRAENPIKIKEFHELSFWSNQKNIEGVLSNSHYEYFYTTHFQIEKSVYDGKVLMDIGCGPRGSLEWASNAKRRIGLDPLASKYVNELGADQHNMEYIASGSENIPLKDCECDFIFSFNSLDHVENFNDTVKEIKRCIASHGIFLLLVEVNHPPATCEPHMLSPKDIIKSFSPEFKAESIEVYKPSGKGLYDSIKRNEKFNDAVNCEEIGWFSAKFIHS